MILPSIRVASAFCLLAAGTAFAGPHPHYPELNQVDWQTNWATAKALSAKSGRPIFLLMYGEK